MNSGVKETLLQRFLWTKISFWTVENECVSSDPTPRQKSG